MVSPQWIDTETRGRGDMGMNETALPQSLLGGVGAGILLEIREIQQKLLY